MITAKQKEAAKKDIKKDNAARQAVSPREHPMALPAGRPRAKPGTKGEGDYYRIIIRPKEEFVIFRYHDVGKPGGIQRLAGKRSSGSWADQAWLISKEYAHVANGKLVPDTSDAREILQVIGPAKHVRGDVFQGHPRKNVPERKKPAPAQLQAQMENIREARKVRQK
jgi:hypothetical protein